MNERQINILRFALNFLKANIEDLELDDDDEGGLLESFGGCIQESEIEAIKQHLGIES